LDFSGELNYHPRLISKTSFVCFCSWRVASAQARKDRVVSHDFGKCGCCYCEYFGGTQKQREKFYKKDYYKYLCAWFRKIDENGRETITISYPRGATKKKSLRAALLVASKMIPRTRSGGRPRKVRSDEKDDLFEKVAEQLSQLPNVSSALRQVALSEGMDPRTLRSALKDRISSLPPLQSHAHFSEK
jgi:hypothetical protein